jgi:hypothetical protein
MFRAYCKAIASHLLIIASMFISIASLLSSITSPFSPTSVPRYVSRLALRTAALGTKVNTFDATQVPRAEEWLVRVLRSRRVC